jgi:SPW repeat
MDVSEFAAGLWALVTGGGVLLLALGYAFVLRRRAGEPSHIQPSERMRAAGRAMHPEDMINVVAGIWLFISPWVLGAYNSGWLTLSNALFGAMIAIFALAAVYRLMPLEELIVAVLGAWIFVSPWVLQPTNDALAWSNWITAAVVVIAAISSIVRMPRQTPRTLATPREGIR